MKTTRQRLASPCPQPRGRRALGRLKRVRSWVAIVFAIGALSGPAAAQTQGRILGRVIDSETGLPVATATARLTRPALSTLSADDGLFLFAVPAGTYTLRIERIAYHPATVDSIAVRPDRTTEVTVRLVPAILPLEPLAAEVERAPLLEPDVSASRAIVLGRELRELPIDAVAEAVELAPGVSDGHFRGGRVGQETYVVDGLDVKNPLEASSTGASLELAPSAVEQIEVFTGGFGAGYGSALSGVVHYVTRRGNPDRWETRLAVRTDHWAPADLFRGFGGISASAGGPLPLLGDGTTVFADILAEGLLDADPRARGLTCLRPEDADADLALAIEALRDDPATRALYCPYTSPLLPFQRGDRWIGFLRVDRPLSRAVSLTVSILHNRRQQELYTPEFKYNADHHLGQRATGALGTVTLDWVRHARGRVARVTVRASALHLDRILGVVDPAFFEERATVGGFGPGGFRFLGEEFIRQEVEAQLRSGRSVPGYTEPAGVVGSPFGPAAEGIFFTEGTPDIANWTRSEFLGADLVGELLFAEGHALRAGVSTRFHRVESYERTLSHLAGSSPSFARFYPRTLSAHAEASLAAADEVTVQLGVRYEAFQPGLQFQRDRTNVLAPSVETRWRSSLSPRIGLAAPVPGSDGRTAARLSYGVVVQPPDFRYFLDTTVGDSLRRDLRRQGNPNLAFERGSAFELGLIHLVSERIALGASAFRKELTKLVTGSVQLADVEAGQFSTGDFGTVRGLELTVRARAPEIEVRAGYALQEATGVTSGALDPLLPDTTARIEFPLSFDRRHSADLAVFAGRAAGSERPWGIALSAFLRSGFPLDPRRAADDTLAGSPIPARLPWTSQVDLRVGYEFGATPGCRPCRWRVLADGRNLLGRDNVIALRGDTGRLAPPLDALQAFADEVPDDMVAIPLESPRYSAQIDLDADGLITASEFRAARFAAALDRHDPSLYFGAPRQLRIGLEVSF